jgi:hypothetical protein
MHVFIDNNFGTEKIKLDIALYGALRFRTWVEFMFNVCLLYALNKCSST